MQNAGHATPSHFRRRASLSASQAIPLPKVSVEHAGSQEPGQFSPRIHTPQGSLRSILIIFLPHRRLGFPSGLLILRLPMEILHAFHVPSSLFYSIWPPWRYSSTIPNLTIRWRWAHHNNNTRTNCLSLQQSLLFPVLTRQPLVFTVSPCSLCNEAEVFGNCNKTCFLLNILVPRCSPFRKKYGFYPTAAYGRILLYFIAFE